MRIILEFDTGADVLPTIRMESGTGGSGSGSSSGTGTAPGNPAVSGAIDGGQAPNTSGAASSQESSIYDLQRTTFQSGNMDAGPAISAGTPTATVNS